MLYTVTKFDTSISVSILLTFIFLIFGLYIVRNDTVSSNKYQRLDFIWSLIFLIPAMILFFGMRLGYFQIYDKIGSIPKNGFLFMCLLACFCIWTWIINVHFRKQIASEAAYRLGVSSFIGWWIIIFYLVAEFLR